MTTEIHSNAKNWGRNMIFAHILCHRERAEGKYKNTEKE